MGKKRHFNIDTMVSFIILLIARTARIACPDRQTDRIHFFLIKWVELARNRNKWLGRTRHPYIRAVHARYHAHTCAQIRKRCGINNCHLVARTCDNEVGVAISIRDPYTSPFTSRCKYDSLAVFYWSAVYAVKP